MHIPTPPPHHPHSILCVVGARPNFMKMAPIMAALSDIGSDLKVSLVHTGQHYDVAMNHQYFEALGIPQPDINLEVGSGSHAVQTADVMRRFEPALDATRPSAVLVVGDVNSTLACALVAAKKCIPVIHVEAGLRSFDRAMPEEINRILTDQISDLLFITESSGRANLLREGIAESRIHFVGNVMIDTLRRNLERAVPLSRILKDAEREDFLGGNTGYAGRVSIVELLVMSDTIRGMVMRHVTSGEVRQQAIAEGMQTMYENGLSKAVAGITTIEEVLRVTREE